MARSTRSCGPLAHGAPLTRYCRSELGTGLLTLTTTAEVTPI
jgi:hypothetical protein